MARQMTKTKVRARAELKTMTRTALLASTTKQALHCFKKYTPHAVQWFLDNLDTILEHQLVVAVELVAYVGDEPITTITFDIDWNEHKVLKSIKNEVDISELDDGETFVSTHQVTEVVRTYLEKVTSSVEGVHFEFWYIRNGAVEDKIGPQKFDELLGLDYDPEKRRQDSKRYSGIWIMKAARKARKVLFPDAEETSFTIK
ncbi:MAG: hypothetical protein AAF709_22440 [Pseudomonadota bacterium]